MPATITKTDNYQIIGGVFSERTNADKAITALRELGIPDSNIQTVVLLDEKEAKDTYRTDLVDRGVSDSQAAYYDAAVRNGKTLVAVHNVTDAAPIIEVFDDYKAEYNLDGSRNLREDVFGMTTGAVVGAVAGGIAGTAVAGPLGAAAGAAAGAVVGGGAGAAAGKAAEHNK